MKKQCLNTYCMLAAAAAAATTGVDGLSSRSHPCPPQSRAEFVDRLLFSGSSGPPASVSTDVFPSSSVVEPRNDGPAHRRHTTSSRREVFQSTKSAVCGALCGWILAPQLRPAMAAAATTTTTDPLVQGTVTVPSGFDYLTGSSKPTPALYITCRPDRPDNVPQAILEGSRGKAPPVLTARYENPTFPFDFRLTTADLTVEGTSTTDSMWWRQDDLLVSARLDVDGVAATRSPEDLVGRALQKSRAADGVVQVALGGRGSFGKFATGSKK